MRTYLDIVKKVLEEGKLVSTRQGTPAYTIAGAMFEHDMSKGFPLLTTKKVPFRLIANELEFFINGITDKKWLQDHNNHIWDEWAKPQKAPYGHDAESKKKMLEERDLGPIYGFQWRHFNAPYTSYDTDYTGQGIDQLKKLIEKSIYIVIMVQGGLRSYILNVSFLDRYCEMCDKCKFLLKNKVTRFINISTLYLSCS